MSSVAHLEMQKISKWDQVKPFIQKIFAYKTDSYYLKGTEYLVKDIAFGYIDGDIPIPTDDGQGYKLLRLKKANEVPSFTILTNEILKSSTYMRLATASEVKAINKAITANEATFDYMDKKEMSTILERHLLIPNQHIPIHELLDRLTS